MDRCAPGGSVIGLFKTEIIRRRGPWRTLEAVEFATLECVDWFNTRRLLEPIGYVRPAEYEAHYYEQAAVADSHKLPAEIPGTVQQTVHDDGVARPESLLDDDALIHAVAREDG